MNDTATFDRMINYTENVYTYPAGGTSSYTGYGWGYTPNIFVSYTEGNGGGYSHEGRGFMEGAGYGDGGEDEED